MKKIKTKLFLAIILILFIGLNMFQSFQINNSGCSIEQMVNTAYANSESDPDAIYYVDNVVENGLCWQCIMGINSECECTLYATYCPSGGDKVCYYDTYIYIHPGTCEPIGGSC